MIVIEHATTLILMLYFKTRYLKQTSVNKQFREQETRNQDCSEHVTILTKEKLELNMCNLSKYMRKAKQALFAVVFSHWLGLIPGPHQRAHTHYTFSWTEKQ